MKPSGTPPRSAAPNAVTSPMLRRRAIFLHLQELVAGREVVDVSAGDDPQAAQILSSKGARRVVTLSTGAARTGLPDASVDVIFALDLEAGELAGAIAELRRVLRAEGIAVLGVPSRDRPGATDGASYYDVVDVCASFARTQMIGLAPFSGATLVEYGVADPEPILDGTLVERGERVEYYVAVAGPDRRGDFGYGVIQLPFVAPAAAVADDAGLRERLARLEAELTQARRAVAVPAAPPRSDLGSDRVVAELRQAIERHAGEMLARQSELAERDAYIAELEQDGRRVDPLEARLTAAEQQRAEAERKESEARRRIAELEGRLLAAGGKPSAGTTTSAGGDEVEGLRRKLAEVEAESWKHVKARSEVEAAAAALREDTVRKLKDARKLASVELMRAMEEATKKAVTLREELGRSEAERKAALAELKTLRASGPAASTEQAGAVVPAGTEPAHHRRDLARAREEGEAAARAAEERAAQLRGRWVALERALAAATEERDEARAQAAAEQARTQAFAAHARGAGARTSDELDAVLREAAERGRAEADQARAREQLAQDLAHVRGELAEREHRLATLEQERPPRSEIDRQRGELDAARTRIAELSLELQRRDALVERAGLVAAHERARSERLIAGERQALAERNDARARAAEAQAKLSGLEAERERIAATLAMVDARAHKAENEIREKRERIRQLKREIEDAERRAAVSAQRGRALEVVRARAQALEAAVLGEASRIAGIEAALREASP